MLRPFSYNRWRLLRIIHDCWRSLTIALDRWAFLLILVLFFVPRNGGINWCENVIRRKFLFATFVEKENILASSDKGIGFGFDRFFRISGLWYVQHYIHHMVFDPIVYFPYISFRLNFFVPSYWWWLKVESKRLSHNSLNWICHHWNCHYEYMNMCRL